MESFHNLLKKTSVFGPFYKKNKNNNNNNNNKNNNNMDLTLVKS